MTEIMILAIELLVIFWIVFVLFERFQDTISKFVKNILKFVKKQKRGVK